MLQGCIIFQISENHGHILSSCDCVLTQANGETEQQNCSMLKVMKMAQATGGDWKAELARYLFYYHLNHTMLWE
jgi:hypothetical protein